MIGIFLIFEGQIHHYSVQFWSDCPRFHEICECSPSLLFAYLRTVYLGMKNLQIGEKAEEILRGLSALKATFHAVEEPMGVLGRHLRNALSKYEETTRAFDRTDLKIGQLVTESAGELIEDEEPPALFDGLESP